MTSLPQAPRYSYAYSASALIMRTTIVSCRHSTNGRKAATPVQQNACLLSWPSPPSNVWLLMMKAGVVPHLRLDSRRRGFMMLPVVPQLALPLEVPDVFHTFIGHGGRHIPAVHGGIAGGQHQPPNACPAHCKRRCCSCLAPCRHYTDCQFSFKPSKPILPILPFACQRSL